MTTPSSPDAPKGRQSLALWIGGGIGVLVVVVVLLVTLAAGGDSGGSGSETPDGFGATVAQTAPTGSMPPSLTENLPEGDYAPLCEELGSQIDLEGTYTTPEQLVEAATTIDVERLLAVAPEGVQPDLLLLQERRDDLLAVLEQVDRVEDISAGDLPEGFADAGITVARIVSEKCQD